MLKQTQKIMSSGWTYEDKGGFEMSKNSQLPSRHLAIWVCTEERDWTRDLGVIDIEMVTVAMEKNKATWGDYRMCRGSITEIY